MILSAITYVRQPPDSAIAFAPRCTEAVSPPSVCASGTTTSSSARPVSTTSPSSDSSYSPSETASCATETGIDTRPVTDSAAFAYGSRSTSGRPSACWRARTESGSFLRVRRGIVRSLVELRFEDDPLAQSFVARIPELRARHQALGLTDEESRATIQALPRHVALHRACGGEPGGWEVEWIEMIWDGKLSELGRLQFEDHGDGVLDVHIPETGLPLEPGACDASFARAREVYPDHHTAQCTSWLLDPQLAEALPPASNIVRFQRRFELRDEGREANDDVRRFVFHTYERDLDRLTPRTTLERALAERMRAGGTWRAPTGVTSLR